MSEKANQEFRGWKYAVRGDYHKNLVPNWPYTSTYFRKMALVRRFIQDGGKATHMQDGGCCAGFHIVDVQFITLTILFLYRKVSCSRPAKFRWLHDLFEPFAIPQFAMINMFICHKT